MSTTLNEWLQKTIAELEEERDAVPGAVNEDADKALTAMKIALASLEAEPVAYIRSAHKPDGFCFADGIHPTHRHQRLPLSTLQDGCYWEVTPLYTAPPAPVSVPDERAVELLATDLMKRIDKITGERHSVATLSSLRVSIVEACRAVMLQGADGNSPVISDGWVACSERMPNDEEDVLCFGQYGDNDIDEERYQFMGWLSRKGIKRVWRVSDGDSQNRRARVTHWMPLPAAPQQEVK
ncbi:DUF551 domain-containing protein [Enterobacter hormaechei]|nr:DUF551 domain-containing protein [Enterobacter hormaechei]